MRKFHFALLVILFYSCTGQHRENENKKAVFPDERSAIEPVLFAEGIISTGDYETHPAFSPGGDTLYFLKCMPDLSTCAICVSYKKNNEWSTPVVTPFSGRYLDADPFVTADGNTIYFISNRPVNATDTLNSSWDIWKVTRDGSAWKDPVHLDTTINSIADEHYPTMSDNGTLFFSSAREGGKGGSDIYCSKLVNDIFSPIKNLGDSINTAGNEYEAFIAPDETYLIYMATADRISNADLYISHPKNDGWNKARKLEGSVNSSSTEWAPKVTRDGKYLFFGSTRGSSAGLASHPETMTEFNKRVHQPGNGLGDIYYLKTSALPLGK